MSTQELLRFAPVRSLLTATTLLRLGTAIQFTAVAKQVYDTSGSELDLAWIGLAEFAPAAALVLVSGTIADRIDRRRLGMIAVAIELVATIGLIAYSAGDPTAVWPFFVTSFVFGVGRSFQAPALRSMPPMVAPDGELPRVIAMSTTAFTAAMIIGPAAAGFLYAAHPSIAYGATAVLLTVSIYFLTRVEFVRQPKPPVPGERTSLHTALEGVRFIFRQPVLLGAITLDLFAVLFGGAVALLPVIAEDRLGVGDIGYGFLRAAIGLGAGMMALFLSFRPIERRVGPVLFASVAVFGLGTIVMGATRSYTVAFIALMVLSAADMVSMIIRGSLVPIATPPEALGRVIAVESVFIGASNELGAFESGFVAHMIGTPLTVIGGGIATLVVVGIGTTVFPTLRRIDRFEDVAPEPG